VSESGARCLAAGAVGQALPRRAFANSLASRQSGMPRAALCREEQQRRRIAAQAAPAHRTCLRIQHCMGWAAPASLLGM
jgi:hypothetical protein